MSAKSNDGRPLPEDRDEHAQADPLSRLQEAVRDLTDFIGADPAAADEKIQKLLKELARSLEMHGCLEPEDVAAEALCRALTKLDRVTDISTSGFRAYVFGIGTKVMMEGWRRGRRLQQLEDTVLQAQPSRVDETAQIEARAMLREIERLLTPEKYELLCRYSTEDDHEAHARELGKTVSHLRVVVHRIREELREKALPERASRPRPVKRKTP